MNHKDPQIAKANLNKIIKVDGIILSISNFITKL